MSIDKIKTLLGFAQKSHNLLSGNELVARQVDKGIVKLVLIGTDVSPNSVKNLKNKCVRLNVPLYQIMSVAVQSQAIGKPNRTVIGVLDARFAADISNLISDMGI